MVGRVGERIGWEGVGLLVITSRSHLALIIVPNVRGARGRYSAPLATPLGRVVSAFNLLTLDEVQGLASEIVKTTL